MPLRTPTFHNLCCKSHVIGDSVLPLRNFRKTEKSPVIHRTTRESNPRPLARQSHLQPLGQRGSHKYFSLCCIKRVGKYLKRNIDPEMCYEHAPPQSSRARKMRSE
uniref:SFRICE_012474 n=1 Tax=Spodoptera frugiperda TaxID=7108 RepID=A0A2H1VE03_SPOFR